MTRTLDFSKERRLILAEIGENVRRCEANIEEIKSFLLYLGDDPAALLQDWEWLWPPLSLQPVLRKAFVSQNWKYDIAADKVQRLYSLLSDQPPNVECLAKQWHEHDNNFYLLIFETLDRKKSEIEALAAEIEECLSTRPSRH
jgi:hypothetical protein